MAYEVTARKWRPQAFEGVIGQDHVTTTLKNAIQAGHIAHAYLFAGPRGVGKTTTARILAKALNCVDGPTVTPCNACTFCHEISEGRSVDVLEIDGASNNRVEQVRSHLLESVKYTPSQGKHKIYIIDEVHMLTKEAFNALLKTLEEPPAHVYFIFATTDPRKVLPTVLSRCQRFDFRRISGPTIVDHLAMISEKSGYDVQREALALIARRVDGSMRDAESLLDQVVAFGGSGLTASEAAEVLGIVDQDVYFELLDTVADQDVPKGLDLVDRIFRQGHDLEEIILGILEHLRNLLVVKAAPEVEALIGDAALELDRYRVQVERFDTEDLLRLSQLATQMEEVVKQSALPRVQLETGIVRMIRMSRSVNLTDIMTRLSEMARRVGSREDEVDTPEVAPPEGTSPRAISPDSSPEDELPSSRNATESAASASETTATPSSLSATAPSSPSAAAPSSPSAATPSSPSAAAPSSRTSDPARDTAPETSVQEVRGPAASAGSSTSTATAPKLDLRTVRNRWSEVVEEVARQRNVLGGQLKEAEVTGWSPADDAGSGGPATITLRFAPEQNFLKQRAEKRENAALIQSVCSDTLGVRVRIICEIGESDAAKDTGPETVAGTGTDEAARGTDSGPGTNAGPGTDEAEPGTDHIKNTADDAGPVMGPHSGTGEDPAGEGRETPATGKTARQAADARAGAAKDPAVMKIVQAFDGQIVTD